MYSRHTNIQQEINTYNDTLMGTSSYRRSERRRCLDDDCVEVGKLLPLWLGPEFGGNRFSLSSDRAFTDIAAAVDEGEASRRSLVPDVVLIIRVATTITERRNENVDQEKLAI